MPSIINFRKIAIILFISAIFAPGLVGAATTSIVIGGGSATLSLSPSRGSNNAGDIFSVNILLNTGGSAVQGVDVAYLNYNPALLEAQDDDGAVAGTQITAGTLMPSTLTNPVESATGKITFSQVTDSGASYTGNGVLATIRFKTLSAGTANVNFDFTAGSTIDTNIASAGNDILGSVTNGAYVIGQAQSGSDTSAPSIPANLSASVVSSSQINLTWSASSDNVAVSGYRVYRNSIHIATTTSASFSDSGLLPSTSYAYTVAAYDGAGNTSAQSSPVTATTQAVSPPPSSGGTTSGGGGGNGGYTPPPTTTQSTTTPTTTPTAAISYPDNTLLKSADEPEIYVISGGQLRWIPSIEVFSAYNYNWGNIKTISHTELNAIPKGVNLSLPQQAVPSSVSSPTTAGAKSSPNLPAGVNEGDLVRGPDGIKVYIVNYHGYRRHIFNPAIFNMYGHFKWDQIKTLGQKTLDSLPASDFYRADGDPRVFSLKEIDESKGLAQKRWFNISGEKFVQLGFKWEQVFIINTKERDYYQEGTPIGEAELSSKIPTQTSAPTVAPAVVVITAGSLAKTADNLTIYYITSNGLKKPLLNPTVFSSYKDNKWENIKIATQAQLEVYPTVQAIKLQGGDDKVYLLDFPNKQKRWIKTSAALARLSIASDKVVSVNQTEFNAYADGSAIE